MMLLVNYNLRFPFASHEESKKSEVVSIRICFINELASKKYGGANISFYLTRPIRP